MPRQNYKIIRPDGFPTTPAPYEPVSDTVATLVVFCLQESSHFAAIQIAIIPFKLERHPRQVFFSAAYRVSLCCQDAQMILPGLIIRHVQHVYDSCFRFGPWDFSAWLQNPPSNLFKLISIAL